VHLYIYCGQSRKSRRLYRLGPSSKSYHREFPQGPKYDDYHFAERRLFTGTIESRIAFVNCHVFERFDAGNAAQVWTYRLDETGIRPCLEPTLSIFAGTVNAVLGRSKMMNSFKKGRCKPPRSPSRAWSVPYREPASVAGNPGRSDIDSEASTGAEPFNHAVMRFVVIGGRRSFKTPIYDSSETGAPCWRSMECGTLSTN